MKELIEFIMQHGVLDMVFDLILTEINHILRYLSTNELNSLTYPVHLNISLLSLLFLLILKIRNQLLFVISRKHIYVLLYYRDHTCFFHALTFARSQGSCLNMRP